MQAEKPPIQIRIGNANFELATVAEAISLLRGIEHATPTRRRRVKTSTIPKTGDKTHA